MSAEIMHRVWKQHLKPRQKLVALYVANSQQTEATAVTVDIGRCAEFAGIPAHQVWGLLQKLARQGVLRVRAGTGETAEAVIE